MSIHSLCFTVKIRKMNTPVHPRFTILKWGVRGYTSHGHVILMRKWEKSFCCPREFFLTPWVSNETKSMTLIIYCGGMLMLI